MLLDYALGTQDSGVPCKCTTPVFSALLQPLFQVASKGGEAGGLLSVSRSLGGGYAEQFFFLSQAKVT